MNIEIKKGTYKLSNELVESLISKINQIKIDIIKIKLDYLFSYISEEEALGKFNKYKEDLYKENKLYEKAEVFYINIADNPNTKILLQTAEQKFFEEINKFKNYCKIYNITSNPALIKTAVETYISSILPLVSSISNFKYSLRDIVQIIEDNNVINYLIEEKSTLESLEYVVEPGKIIKNKK